jgi:proteasome lid subunit RPN8/RPN11
MTWSRRRSVDIIRGGGTARLIEGGRTRSAASAPSTGVELLNEAESTFVLKLGMNIRGDIERECSRINHLAYDQLGAPAEAGGYLFAHYSARADGVQVVYASADASEHTTHSVLLNDPVDVMKAIRAGEHGEYLAQADLRLIGSWHSHPVHDPTPSRQDLENWAHRLQRSGADSWATLIVTPSSPERWGRLDDPATPRLSHPLGSRRTLGHEACYRPGPNRRVRR